MTDNYLPVTQIHALSFKPKWPDCGRMINWVYDDEEAPFRTDSLTGCPSDGCTRIHEVSAQKVDEDKAAEIEGGLSF